LLAGDLREGDALVTEAVSSGTGEKKKLF